MRKDVNILIYLIHRVIHPFKIVAIMTITKNLLPFFYIQSLIFRNKIACLSIIQFICTGSADCIYVTSSLFKYQIIKHIFREDKS